MEAIEFFVTAYEFGVSNSMEGIRRMMVLVFAKEPGIKEAVVAAYKRLYLNVPGLPPRSVGEQWLFFLIQGKLGRFWLAQKIFLPKGKLVSCAGYEFACIA